MHFYTSININYLPKARVLARSVKRYCPDAWFSLVFSDQWPADIDPENEPFDEIIRIKNLGIPVDNLPFWIYQHTVVELCTAVKGQALVKFLEEGSEKVLYLDPDIAVFHPLDELEQMLDTNDIILTPHQTFPENNKKDIINNEICSLQHGAYNFGFYAVHNTESGRKFAKWWRDRLIDYCYNDIPNGLFTDQKWGDLVPCMFDGVHILRDPGYNVSTWNLSNRTISKGDKGEILVNQRPLQFYHFSGFDSGAQAVMLELYGNDNPILLGLREWYIKQQDLEGQKIYGSAKSKYNYYDSGEKVDNLERTLLRNRKDLIQQYQNTNPYITGHKQSYYKWYKEKGYKANSEVSELERIYHSRSWKIACFISGAYIKCKKILYRGGSSEKRSTDIDEK